MIERRKGKHSIFPKKRFVSLLCLLAVMIVVFAFSNQSGEKSRAISNAVAKRINIQNEASTVPIFLGMSLRKFAHVFLFALLGIAAMALFQSWWKAGLFCYGCACLDELHQSFVDGRQASLTDTFVDAIGFGIVILTWVLFAAIRSMKKFKDLK